MAKTTPRKQRSKIEIILLAPLLAVIFLFGWTLYNIGEPNHTHKQKPTKIRVRSQEDIELMAIPRDEQSITI